MNNKGLFVGAADDYEKYRPKLPATVLDYLVQRFALNRTSVAVDLGTGTGDLARQIQPFVGRVLAIDPDPEMLRVAQEASSKEQAHSIEWRLGRAEEWQGEPNQFALVAASRAFHWMDQDRVLRQSLRCIAPGGGFATIADQSLWTGVDAWQETTKHTIQEFLGVARRAGTGCFAGTREPYDALLERSGFVEVESIRFAQRREWSFERILGYLYSTTFASKALFGEKLGAFESRLHEALGRPKLNTLFVEHAVFRVHSGRKPA